MNGVGFLELDFISKLKDIAEITSNFATVLAIIAGALWAYFKYVRHRMLKPRLEFGCNCTIENKNCDLLPIIISIKVKNVGLTKVSLPDQDKHLAVYIAKEPYLKADVGKMDIGERLYQCAVFKENQWIEPNESINDTVFLYISRDLQAIGLLIKVKIFSKTTWSESWAFSL